MWKTSKPVSSGAVMIALLASANARARVGASAHATPSWQKLRAAQAQRPLSAQ